MIQQDLIDRIIGLLAPGGFIERQEAESRYPRRQLPAGAEVTRIAPSPTGFVHIGTIYTAMVSERIAHMSKGLFFIRIEDTDKAREVAGAAAMIEQKLNDFGIHADESPAMGGTYGSYVQSEREKLYLGYAIDALRRGRAYPCFATKEELDELRARQQTEKVRPGYYGEFALWRDKSESDIMAALDAGLPFVLRFRSLGDHEKKISFDDALKGHVEMAQNDQDIPLIKSSGLPTYHLAHIVDDYLMGTTVVTRTDEWLPSVPLHIELAEAFEVPPFRYAHPAPLSKLDNGNKRKLSKRKDPEADVAFWQAAGYPISAIRAYLMGLANSNFEDWWREQPQAAVEEFPFSIDKLASSRGALVDMQKVRDYGKEIISRLSLEQFTSSMMTWAREYAPDFYELLCADMSYTSAVLSIERAGENARKDIACWSDAPEHYGFMYDVVFRRLLLPAVKELDVKWSRDKQNEILDKFMAVYNPADDRSRWFEKLKAVGRELGYADDMKAYRADPTAFAGSISDVATIMRVRLTGKTRTPDLCEIMRVLGTEQIAARIGAA